MAIRIKGSDTPVDQRALLEVCVGTFPAVRPGGLFEQIVTRYDFANRTFASSEALLDAIGRDVAEEATDIDLAKFESGESVFAQFKTVQIGRVGPLKVVHLAPGKLAGSATALAN